MLDPALPGRVGCLACLPVAEGREEGLAGFVRNARPARALRTCGDRMVTASGPGAGNRYGCGVRGLKDSKLRGVKANSCQPRSVRSKPGARTPGLDRAPQSLSPFHPFQAKRPSTPPAPTTVMSLCRESVAGLSGLATRLGAERGSREGSANARTSEPMRCPAPARRTGSAARGEATQTRNGRLKNPVRPRNPATQIPPQPNNRSTGTGFPSRTPTVRRTPRQAGRRRSGCDRRRHCRPAPPAANTCLRAAKPRDMRPGCGDSRDASPRPAAWPRYGARS